MVLQVGVVVIDELTAAIGTEVLEAKLVRHDSFSHECNQSHQRLVLRRFEVDRLERGVVVGVLGHEAVVPARRIRHRSREVDTAKFKPLRDFCLPRLVAKWLLGARVDLADVSRGQLVNIIDSRLGDVLHGLHSEPVQIS